MSVFFLSTFSIFWDVKSGVFLRSKLFFNKIQEKQSPSSEKKKQIKKVHQRIIFSNSWLVYQQHASVFVRVHAQLEVLI